MLTDYARSVLTARLHNRAVSREVADAIDFSVGFTTGNTFFVHHSGADSSGSGRSKQSPFATLDYAISQATASQGDVVYIMPFHAENATGTIDAKAGVTVIGLGHGAGVPTITFTAAAGTIQVGAANFTLSNVKLVANFATGTTSAITIAAAGDGCTLDRIQFRDTSATSEFLVHVSVATTVTDLVIQNCSFVTLAGSLTNSILFAGSSSNVTIRKNTFFVDSSDSVIDHLAAAGVNLSIEDNYIFNQDTGAAGYVIDCHASTTGQAVNNRGGYNEVNAEMTKGDGMFWIENYFSNTIAQSGLLDPATSHAIP